MVSLALREKKKKKSQFTLFSVSRTVSRVGSIIFPDKGIDSTNFTFCFMFQILQILRKLVHLNEPFDGSKINF